MNRLNYIGCKHTLSDKILDIIQKQIPGHREKSLLDLFAGTGTIGFHSAPFFRTVSANDWEYYSYVINSALLLVPFTEHLRDCITRYNHLESKEGLIFQELTEKKGRLFFTEDNAKKADAIRVNLEKEKEEEIITTKEYLFLLASLLTSIDKVANTTSVYGAFLKQFKKSALKPLLLEPIHTRTTEPHKDNRVFHGKAEDFPSKCDKRYDIIYLDPPYNQRQYAANYSPLNFIAEYNPSLVVKGKTGLLEGYNKSDFCKKTRVKAAFQQLLDTLDADYLVLSYNNEGLLGKEDLKEMLQARGKVTLYTIPYKKYKSAKETQAKEEVEEYLWFIEMDETVTL